MTNPTNTTDEIERKLPRSKAEAIFATIHQTTGVAIRALAHAPYGVAARAVRELEELADTIGAEVGLGEFVGFCESCDDRIFSDEPYSSGDGYLCHHCADAFAHPQTKQQEGR